MTSSKQYFNRDVSWLSFNYRVLQEAQDESLPLADRLKFLAIYSSNLDEFFRVRVASIRSLAEMKKKKLRGQLDFNPREILQAIHDLVDQQQCEYGETFRKSILPGLRNQKIILYQGEPLLDVHHSEVNKFFRSKVLSYLQPVFIGTEKRAKSKAQIPSLKSRTLYFAVELRSKNASPDTPTTFAYLNIPSDKLTRFIRLSPVKGYSYFLFIDDIIRFNLHSVFPGYKVIACFSFKLNRAEDMGLADEYDGDLVQKVKEQLDKRKIGIPIRFLYDTAMPTEILALFAKIFHFREEDLVPGGRYHNLSDLMKLPIAKWPELASPDLPPLDRTELECCESMFDAIDERDRIIHLPYHSYDPVLRFFNEAAIDPKVKEIKVTFYRIASNSLIANALISAAKNGKKVTVFVEVKARFDEANNLRWAEEMEQAGIHIMYSIPGLKVHAKVALVKRVDANGKLKGYAYFSTGNFNEITADLYADHGLFTHHHGMIKELDQVFRYLKKKTPIRNLCHLLVAHFNLQARFLELLDREIAHAKSGLEAYAIIKLNGLEDNVMIDKLYDASCAGVRIDLIVRGICCLVPGVKELSENIRVIRLVDQYLEHARVFIFHNNGNEEMFLSSADWMNRNLYRRIEVGFPIYDAEVREELRQIIRFQLDDNVKACTLDEHLQNIPVLAGNNPIIRAQTETYEWLRAHESIPQVTE